MHFPSRFLFCLSSIDRTGGKSVSCNSLLPANDYDAPELSAAALLCRSARSGGKDVLYVTPVSLCFGLRFIVSGLGVCFLGTVFDVLEYTPIQVGRVPPLVNGWGRGHSSLACFLAAGDRGKLSAVSVYFSPRSFPRIIE